MNPTHLETYIEGLHKTIDSKLFFLDKLPDNFFRNPEEPKVIIDLGCGDGTVLKTIKEHYSDDNQIFVAIDNNPDILNYTKINIGQDALYFKTLKEFTDFIVEESWIRKYKFVLICESVLHEVGKNFQEVIYDFAFSYCDYFIIRDMFVQDNEYTRNKMSIQLKNRYYANVIRYSNTTLLTDFVEHYGLDIHQLIHYLLKYTYVENWRTEVEEDYTSVNWHTIDDIEWHANKVIYDRQYVQEWRRNRVREDFDIDMNDFCTSTHREVIIKIR